LIIESIACTPEERYELIHGAYKLFAEVDINDDKHMEWAEFMQFIIDAVMETSVSNQGNEKKQTVMQLIQQLRANKFRRFYSASKPVDKSTHLNIILK